jgi:hypothetical protein
MLARVAWFIVFLVIASLWTAITVAMDFFAISSMANQVGSAKLFLLMALLPFNLTMLWLFGMLGRAFKPEPPLLSTFPREDGSECVKLGGLGTAAWVFLALGGSALAFAAMLGGLTGGFNAPLPVGVGAWGAIIACGVFAGRWSHARQKAGYHDLRLHAEARTLSLPPISTRKHRLDMRWSNVRSLRVDPHIRTRRGRPYTLHQLTLELFTADGGVRQETIAIFDRQEQAEVLAHWLRTRLEVGKTAPVEQRST